MNFILWLIGKDYNPTSFVNRYSGSRPRFVHTAPLPEMWGYVRKEAVEGKRLRLEDYSPSFLSWICRYIGHDPALVLATGASLAGTAAKKIVSRIHKHSPTTSSSTPFQVAEPSGSDNQECERQSTCDSTNTSAAHSRNRSPSILHRPLVDDGEIPMPLDDSYDDDYENQGPPIESEACSDEAGKPTTCHGTAVKVYKNGRVIISSAVFPLEFRTSNTQAQKICSFGSTPRIHFSPTDIEIGLTRRSSIQSQLNVFWGLLKELSGCLS